MTVRGTGVLLGLLGALAGYLWVTAPDPAPPAGSQAPPLLAASPGAVARVELAEGERRVTALRAGDGWADAAGHSWPDGAVSDLLTTLAALRPVTTVDPEPAVPADYGLGPGARHLELAGAGGHPLLALELGERNPAWTGLYARRTGEPAVLLVGAVLGWELDKLRRAAPGGDP